MFNFMQSPTNTLDDPNDTKTWTCANCTLEFQQSKQLESHARETRHKAYRCTKDKDCNSSFISRSSCIRHERKHRVQRAHICTRCPASFHRSDHLQGHVQTCRGHRRRPRIPPRVEPTSPGPSRAKIQFEAIEFYTTTIDNDVPGYTADTWYGASSTMDTPGMTSRGALDFATTEIDDLNWTFWESLLHIREGSRPLKPLLTADEGYGADSEYDLGDPLAPFLDHRSNAVIESYGDRISNGYSQSLSTASACMSEYGASLERPLAPRLSHRLTAASESDSESNDGPTNIPPATTTKSDDVAATQSNTVDEPNDHQPRSKIAKFFSKLKAYIKAPFRRHKR